MIFVGSLNLKFMQTLSNFTWMADIENDNFWQFLDVLSKNAF